MQEQNASGPRDGCIHTRWFRSISPPDILAISQTSICEILVFMVYGVRQNLYVFSLYRNPDIDDRIFDCLLASIAAVQADDVRASFLFVSDLNSHHQEFLGSTTTNSHGVASFNVATASCCD